MKKFNKSIKLFSVLLSAFLVFSSCQIGLGPAIDLEAPIVELTSHKDNDYVGQTFKLEGTVTDNEKVKSIAIDFEEADIHYRLENGVWKKKTSYVDWTVLTEEYCSYSLENKTIYWSVWVNTKDSKVGIGSTYNFTIVAEDDIGNSGKLSKLEGSLVVDENIPNIVLNSPELFVTYKKLEESFPNLVLKDGNVLSQLFNGTIVLDGRQDASASFKEFRIEFDDGITDSKVVDSNNYDIPISSVTTEEISNTYQFERQKLYYSKTLKIGENNISDLRTWNIQIKPEEWISEVKNSELASGKHKIRIVATSISSSDTWQRKVLGFFTWYPEADRPWITIYSGKEDLNSVSTDKTFPSTKIFGLVQDDDGIKNLIYSLSKQNKDKTFSDIKKNEPLALAEENTKNSQWFIESPAESAIYKLSVTVTDIYNNVETVERYFNVLDVQSPEIEFVTPSEGSNVFSYAGTSIPFKGVISDDGKLKTVKIAYINPNETNGESILKYINYSEPDWNKTEDDIGNKIFTVPLPVPSFDSTEKRFVYNIDISLDLFNHLDISSDRPLKTQDFVVLAIDEAGGSTVCPLSVGGDVDAPEISINKLERYNGNDDKVLSIDLDGEPITLGVIKQGDYAKIYGTWKDNSTSHWRKYDKINDILFNWEGANFTDLNMNDDGTWNVKVSQIPKADGTLMVTLQDYAKNISSVSQQISIDKSEIGLERIASDSEDGSYKAGSKIDINLIFTKNAEFIEGDSGTPTLLLNNNGVAYYVEGNGTSKMTFQYTVDASHSNVTLDVSAINSNGCKWQDLIGTEFLTGVEERILTDLKTQNKVLYGRKLVIDNSYPKIQNVSCLSNDGAYKEGSELTFQIEFNEAVNIENNIEFILNFGTGLEHVSTSKVGSNTLLSKYLVQSSVNQNPVVISGIYINNLNYITDVAGNPGNESIKTYKKTFDNISIDNEAPAQPSISKVTNNSIIIDDTKVTFKLDGVEQGATAYYSIDNGLQWTKYTDSDVTLENNGVYKIKSKQTDAAGNDSPTSNDPIIVTIDRGALLKKISAKTPNGTYNANKTIEGFLEFRGKVILPSGAKVKLNVGNDGKLVDIKNPTTEANIFYFDYEIAEGDFIKDSASLNVGGFNFEKVTYAGSSQNIKIPESNLNVNKDIKILTGKTKVENVSIQGQDSSAVLTVGFDRPIFKGNGTIVLEQTDDFRVPTVLTVTEYNELKAVLGSDIDSYYTKGVNGATKEEDSNYLTPDTSTKYILNFDTENNDETLVGNFKAKSLHKVEIPIYSSAVSVDGSTLTAKLTGEYKLPVKGATYSVTISEGAVIDSIENKNESTKVNIVASGVEKPEIRIEKTKSLITWLNFILPTSNSSVRLPEQAKLKISCRTPNTLIKYKVAENSSNEEKVNDILYHEKNVADVIVPAPTDTYDSSKDYSLGTNNLTFDTAKGLVVAISAQAIKKDNQNNKSIEAYEAAYRTVLKFEVNSNGYDDDQGKKTTAINENGGDLNITDLKVWVTGGDSPSGDSSIETFPLSWGDFSKFQLMKKQEGDPTNGKWYWVTWDLTAPAYHGFVVGDVPYTDEDDNAQTKGPTKCYAGECSWNSVKTNYILYPGATLNMQLIEGHNNGGKANYFFRIKNLMERNKS